MEMKIKLEAKDVLPNCMQAAERDEKCCVFVHGDLDL